MNIEEVRKVIKGQVDANVELNDSVLADINAMTIKEDGCVRAIEKVAEMGRDIEVRASINDTLQWVLDMLEDAEMPTNRVYMQYSTMLYCKLSVLKDMAEEEGIDDATREYRRGKLIGAVSAVADIYGYSFNRVDTDLEEVAR